MQLTLTLPTSHHMMCQFEINLYKARKTREKDECCVCAQSVELFVVFKYACRIMSVSVIISHIIVIIIIISIIIVIMIHHPPMVLMSLCPLFISREKETSARSTVGTHTHTYRP
jgi:hypothetical protein